MNDLLRQIRHLNGWIAYLRDEGYCMYCHWVKGIKNVNAGETDHVFGRGSIINPANELWLVRLTLCQECHHQKHHGKDGWFSHKMETLALKNAIEKPRLSPLNIEFGAISLTDFDDVMQIMQSHTPMAERFLNYKLRNYGYEDLVWPNTNLRRLGQKETG